MLHKLCTGFFLCWINLELITRERVNTRQSITVEATDPSRREAWNVSKAVSNRGSQRELDCVPNHLAIHAYVSVLFFVAIPIEKTQTHTDTFAPAE